MSDPNFDAFKRCVKIEANLDLEAWDVILFQPLKDLANWWGRQNEKIKAYTALLGPVAAAFTRWIARVAGITAADVAGLMAESLTAVMVGLALGAFMDIASRCLARIAL